MFASLVPQLDSLVLVGLFTLCAGSWGLIWGRLARGVPIVPWRDRPRIEWPGILPLVAFPLVYIVSAWIHLAVPQKDPPDLLQSLQVDCLSRLVCLGTLLLFPLAFRQWNRENLGLHRGPIGPEIAFGLGTACAVFLPVMAINFGVAAAGWKDPDVVHPLLQALKSGDSRIWPWVALSAVVLAPLLEELQYRVFVQGTLEDRVGLSGWTSINLSSLLFCGVHFAPGRPDGLALFPLAFALGFLYWRRRSYIAVVVAHATFNGINLVMALLSASGDS